MVNAEEVIKVLGVFEFFLQIIIIIFSDIFPIIYRHAPALAVGKYISGGAPEQKSSLK